MLPLGLLVKGEKAEVVYIGSNLHSSDRGKNTRASVMEILGFRAGKTVEMVDNGGKGPLLIRLDESRIALGCSAAMGVIVRRTK